MPKKLWILGITASLAIAAGAVTMASLAPSASAQTTLTVIEHATTDKVIDVGKKGDSPGDLLTFHNKVYDQADATVIGDDQGYCVRISPKKGSWECNYTVFLEDGQITVETPFYDTADSVGTVTGGTGTYAGAGGSQDLHCFVGNDDVLRCEFTFNLA